MRQDWLQTATDAIRRSDHRNGLAGAVAGLGAALAIGGMEWLSVASHYPLVIIPFATSIVLVIGSPEAEPAQPRALIGRHILATLAGHFLLRVTGPYAWAAAAAVGLAIPACMSPDRFIRRQGSIPSWWSPITFHGRFCSCRCLPARCY